MNRRAFRRRHLVAWVGSIHLILAIIAVTCLYGCKPRPSGPGVSQPIRFTFAQIPIIYSAVSEIAGANGYFAQEGLQYSVFSVPAGPDVVTALKASAGSGVGAGAIAITPVITMIGAGDHPVILATTLSSNRQTKLVTFARTGITHDAQTLKGKRIGVTLNTNGDIYLSRLLRKGRLTSKDVTLVNGRPADLQGLLLRGDLDAAVLWDPFVVQTVRQAKTDGSSAQSRGELRVLVDPSLHTLAFNIVTTQEKLNRNRDALVRVLRALIKAELYIHDHPKEAQEALEKWLRLQPGDLDDFFATTEFHVQADAPRLKNWMAEELVWLRERRPDTQVPVDLTPFVDDSLLKSIDPGRVRE